VYRSKQRGFLELDLVLGNWVEENIRSMDELRIKALIDVLDLVLQSLFIIKLKRR
jgi:succinate dehydrogenase flavin-adding protein (antitoxin of CptAB toxin-antitoxin module)